MKFNILSIFICTCLSSYSEETGYKAALKIAADAISTIDTSKAENSKDFDETLKMCDKDNDSSGATYKITRIQYKAILQSLLIECDQIESEELSNEEKAKQILILVKKGELLNKYLSESKGEYIRRLLVNHPRLQQK